MTTLNTQNSYNQSFGTSTTCQLTGVATGDTLVLCLRERDGSAAPTVSDDINGSWGTALVTVADGTRGRASIFRFINAASGNPIITIDYSGINRVFQGIAAAFTPTGAITDGNTSTNTTTTTTAQNAGSVTASAGFMVACGAHASNDGGSTAGDSFTAFTMTAGEREYHRYKLTSGETVDADYTTTNSVSANHSLAAFTEASGGGGKPYYAYAQM